VRLHYLLEGLSYVRQDTINIQILLNNGLDPTTCYYLQVYHSRGLDGSAGHFHVLRGFYTTNWLITVL